MCDCDCCNDCWCQTWPKKPSINQLNYLASRGFDSSVSPNEYIAFHYCLSYTLGILGIYKGMF